MSFQEPPVNAQDDTQPIIAPKISGLQRFIGAGMLLGAVGLTFVTVILLMSPPPVTVIPVTNAPAGVETIASTTVADDAAATEVVNPPVQDNVVAGSLPTLSFEAQGRLLQTPVSPMTVSNSLQVIQNALDPFTIIPDRPRNTMTLYTIQKGDTIYDIARRFNLTQETIAWSNDRRQIWTLIPGDTLNIPPSDGVYIQAVGQTTIRELAAQYQVDDPRVVLDSEANNMTGLNADSVPPSGMWIFIPGGVAEEVNWAPQIVTGSSGTSGSNTSGSSGNQVGFQLGDPGSCGLLDPGVATVWSNPMTHGSYTITRGFSSWHPGIDMAATPGTAIYAANGGRVIFAGRNNWGYGLAVVISSGPFQTLYGHMSILNVSCGQVVSSGQIIGGVGSTGNSSGPHLHFEIMYNGVRSDPAATLAF